MVTATIGKEHYKTEIVTVGDHHLTADEPGSAGGTDQGPAPRQFVLAALASCTVITVRMYADRKNIPAEKISATVAWEKKGNVTSLNLSLSIEGDLSEEARARLLQIAQSCPVHKMLTEPIEIKTELV